MDLTTKKFSITLPSLLGILSIISTIIGGYWYFKNTIEITKSNISQANDQYKELKLEVQVLRSQLYEMAIAYNKNIHLDNEINSFEERRFRNNISNEFDSFKVKTENSNRKKLSQKDTINLTNIKLNRPTFKSNR